MTSGKIEHPFLLHRDAIDETRPAGRSLNDAVRYALDELRVLSHHVVLTVSPSSFSSLRGRVLLVALSPGTVLVVGVSSLAHAVRDLFDPIHGFTAWQLAALPATRTPLHHLKPHLRTRQYNVLARRYEFATVEEVAAVPTDVWPEMTAVGTSLLRAVETALSTVDQDGSAIESATAGTGSSGEHGWHLQVSADGMQATVHAPNPVALTALSGTSVQLTQTDQPDLPPKTADDGQSTEPVWSVEIAEQILRRAQPSGSTFLRTLIDEGGTATAERLRERTGLSALHHATQTLSNAAAVVLVRHHPDGRRWRRFVKARPHPDQPRGRVYDYYLPEHLVLVFSEALQRLGR